MARRILLGNLPDGGSGLRVSKAGLDAGATPPDPTLLIFDSAWPAVLPIHQVGVATIGQFQTVTVNFPQLTITPLFSIVAKGPGGNEGNWSNAWTVRPGCYSNPASNDIGQGDAYFSVVATPSSIVFAQRPATNGAGWPATIYAAYVIYKTGAATP